MKWITNVDLAESAEGKKTNKQTNKLQVIVRSKAPCHEVWEKGNTAILI
jgi:hypothetical protein